MVVTCPNCRTQFNLADDRYVPGRKARCSVCSHYFILMAKVADDEPAVQAAPPQNQDQKVQKKPKVQEKPVSGGLKKEKPVRSGVLKRIFLFFFLLLFLAGLGVGGYWVYDNKFASFRSGSIQADPVAARIADPEKVRDFLLVDVKHRYVQNVKLGPLVVVTGSVRNNFNTAKEKIRVEATLLDKSGKVLAVQQQYCGIVLTDMQLEILGKRELDQALADSFLMLANNINIQPGKEVPFMVVFVYPPTSMTEYSVAVSDVSDPPGIGGKK